MAQLSAAWAYSGLRMSKPPRLMYRTTPSGSTKTALGMALQSKSWPRTFSASTTVGKVVAAFST